MKIIIIGPTLLTRHCVESLLKSGRDALIVYTLEDRLAQTKSRFINMDDLAEDGRITLHKVANINDTSVVEQIRNYEPDVIFELGWSQIISPAILKIPKRGCIGVHASMLPKNRGAASLNWAIIKGEKKTGVTLFYLAEKPDDGDIIAQKEFDIDDRDDISTLHAKSDLVSAELILENLDNIRNGDVKRIRQDISQVTFTRRRSPDDGVIDWRKNSYEIYNWIRAQTHPFPGAFTFWKGKKLYIWKSKVYDTAAGSPGEILEVSHKKGVVISTADGSVMVKRAQFEGEAEMWADEVAVRHGIKKGDILG